MGYFDRIGEVVRSLRNFAIIAFLISLLAIGFICYRIGYNKGKQHPIHIEAIIND